MWDLVMARSGSPAVVTVKLEELVPLPPSPLAVIVPEVAPGGTVAVIWFVAVMV